MIWLWVTSSLVQFHYSDIMGAIVSEITSLTTVSWTDYSGADQRKHQSPASLAFVRGIHRWPVNSPHKWSVTRKMFPFDDVIMSESIQLNCFGYPTQNANPCKDSLPFYPPGCWVHVSQSSLTGTNEHRGSGRLYQSSHASGRHAPGKALRWQRPIYRSLMLTPVPCIESLEFGTWPGWAEF